MEIRPATTDDRHEVEQAARRSFRASYALSPQEIGTVLAAEFSDEEQAARIDADEDRLFVADRGDAPIAGFAEFGADDALHWLHVRPDARGQGVGTALVERARRAADERSVPFTAKVLESATEGGQFLERFDLYPTETTSVEFGDEQFTEVIYSGHGRERDPGEPSIDVPETAAVAGKSRRVRRESAVAGTLAPFYPLVGPAEGDGRGANRDAEDGGTGGGDGDGFWGGDGAGVEGGDGVEDGTRKVGYLCGQCGTTDVHADELGRLECDGCENVHRPDDWDQAYL